VTAKSPDQLGEAMLALADRLFEDFKELPVITVIRAINASRAELAVEPLEVHAVENLARERLRDKVVYYAVSIRPDGRRRTAGSFAKRDAEKAADAQEKAVNAGDWVDPTQAKMTFRAYVETHSGPTTVYLEVSTRSAYRYYTDTNSLRPTHTKRR
jgi:hypothetical protein